MTDIIINFIKERCKILYTPIMILIAISLLYKYLDFIDSIGPLLFDSLKVILSHILSLIFLIGIIIGKTLIFKYSDTKSREANEEYEKPFTFETIPKYDIKFYLTKRTESFNNTYGETLEIILQNLANSDIFYIKGFVGIYREGIRIKRICFETQNLYKNRGERLYYDLLIHGEQYWDYFDIFIEKIQTENLIKCDIKIEGKRFFRSYSKIFNIDKFYNYRFFGLKTKYNMAWLKKKLHEEIIPFVKFFYSRKKIYSYSRPLLSEFKDNIIQFVKFLLFILIVLILFSSLLFAFIDIYKMLSSIFAIWKNYI